VTHSRRRELDDGKIANITGRPIAVRPQDDGATIVPVPLESAPGRNVRREGTRCSPRARQQSLDPGGKLRPASRTAQVAKLPKPAAYPAISGRTTGVRRERQVRCGMQLTAASERNASR